MRRKPVTISSDARADLAGIRRYYRGVAGPSVAARMMERLKTALKTIGETPEIGARRPEYGDDVRLRLCAPYVIYVAVGDDRVEVLRVLHSARDRDAIMGASDDDPEGA